MLFSVLVYFRNEKGRLSYVHKRYVATGFALLFVQWVVSCEWAPLQSQGVTHGAGKPHACWVPHRVSSLIRKVDYSTVRLSVCLIVCQCVHVVHKSVNKVFSRTRLRNIASRVTSGLSRGFSWRMRIQYQYEYCTVYSVQVCTWYDTIQHNLLVHRLKFEFVCDINRPIILVPGYELSVSFTSTVLVR